VGQSAVAYSSQRRVPEKLLDGSSAQVVLDAPVCCSILLLLASKRLSLINFIVEDIEILDNNRLAGYTVVQVWSTINPNVIWRSLWIDTPTLAVGFCFAGINATRVKTRIITRFMNE
jgi:hypothetical protein